MEEMHNRVDGKHTHEWAVVSEGFTQHREPYSDVPDPQHGTKHTMSSCKCGALKTVDEDI